MTELSAHTIFIIGRHPLVTSGSHDGGAPGESRGGTGVPAEWTLQREEQCTLDSQLNTLPIHMYVCIHMYVHSSEAIADLYA